MYETLEPFPTIEDLEIEPLLTEYFGVQMVWRSASLGVVTEFPWWDNLERNARLDDPTWWPVGTVSQPYVDAEQNWTFMCWEDDDFVYVLQGHDFASWERRFRVPTDTFRSAWRRGVRRIKASVPPPQIDNDGQAIWP
jgi:hypothetical protein